MVSSEGGSKNGCALNREEDTACRHRERAQSSTIGVTLVFGFAIVGSVLIVALGVTALGDAQQNLGEDRAEKALTQFDSKTALVALGNTDTQTVSFARASDDFSVRDGTGWMRITIDNRSDGQKPETLLNQSMGSVVYENDRMTLAYQGGGVWRRQSNNSQMVSPPEFHFRDGTLTLPVINVTGDESLGDSATITHNQTTKQFPNNSKGNDFENPLTDHRVKVTVQSDYYKGWGDYFEERTDGEVDYDHNRQLVNLTLVTPLEKDTITSATASLSASGDFIITGSAADSCHEKVYTNSYDSDVDSYCSGPFPGDEGDIVYGGDVDIDKGSGGSYINGDVIAGGSVSVSGSNGGGQPYVRGNINYTVSCDTKGGPPTNTCKDRIDPSSSGSVNSVDGVESAPKIDQIVNRTVYNARNDNDNGDSSTPISSNRLDFSASSPSDEATLTAGTYYLDRIDFSGGDEVELDTTGGNITLAVRGDVEMPDDAEIQVTGDKIVKVYVNGESSFSNGDTWTWDMNKDTTVTNPGDNSPQFRVYGQSDFSFRIDSGVDDDENRFVGVIFAPPGSSGTGEVLIKKGHIFGGVLTGTTEIATGGSIHYDQALQDKKILSQSARIPKVTYLHVSINRIDVTD